MEHKLKTKIDHFFFIESDLMDELNFTFDLNTNYIKEKSKIIEVKNNKLITHKFKKDVSTKLF